MRAYFLNVGYGESVVIQQYNRAVIIDGGCGRADTSIGEIRLIDFLNNKNIEYIDLVICTHMHEDHIGGLVAVFEQYKVRKFICNMYTQEPLDVLLEQVKLNRETYPELQLIENSLTYYKKILQQIEKKNTIVEQKYWGTNEEIYQTQILFYGLNKEESIKNRKWFEQICKIGDVEAIIEYDKVLNTTSLAMYISGVNMFLTGDLVEGYENFKIPEVHILKLTHHGQVDGMGAALLEKTQPSIFLICTNRERKYNSACPEIIARCQKYFEEKKMITQIYITGNLEKEANGILIEDGNCTTFYLEGE